MTFYELVRNAIADTLGPSLPAFLPEVLLCATIVLLLLTRMIVPKWQSGAFYVMLIGSAAALLMALSSAGPSQFVAQHWTVLQGVDGEKGVAQLQKTNQLGSSDKYSDAEIWEQVEHRRGGHETFTGLLKCDPFSIYMRCLLLFFLLLFTTFTLVGGVPGRDEATEFYVLVLGALLGMCLMVSANHLIIVFLGVEMASVPSYVLAGLRRHRREGTEAALKYAVFGAGCAGVMLYGISLLVGTLGSAHLPTMALRLAEMIQGGAEAVPLDTGRTMVLVLGGLMVMVGLAFKLSAVPFHFWAPDVFEGATAEVAAFLSIASKAAALGLLVRLAVGLSAVDNVAMTAALEPVRQYICGLIALLAAVTCTFGNLAAYGQTNMKRLLAYSTIAHAGYMMMPVAAAVALAGSNPAGAHYAIAAVAFYLAVYLFMNLGAFAAVAFLRNVTGSEQIADYAGLVRRSPGLVVCLSLIFFSLLGLPPLAGFTAKFAAFAAVWDARLMTLLVIGGLNTVLSLFYYLRVVKTMILDPEPDDRPAAEIPLLSVPGAFLAAITLPLLLLFVWWSGLFDFARTAASTFLFGAG